jgi:hypothetical protein
MKQSQAVVLIVILIATVGGVAFVRNWIFTKGTGPDGPPPLPDRTIDFGKTVAERVTEFELHGHGHYDFRFQNPEHQPVELGLNSKSCKCSQVEALVLTEEEEKKIGSLYAVAGAVQALETAAGLFHPLAPAAVFEQEVQRFLERSGRWQGLLEDGSKEGNPKVIQVPPKATGYVRLKWEAKQLGPERLAARVWVQAPGEPKTRGPETSLEVPVVIVPAIRVHPDKFDLPDLRMNQSHGSELVCFSSTRPAFKLVSVREESDNPCFVFHVTPLKGEELEQAAKTLERITGNLACAYRVRVTVYERLPDGSRQLDLGPFQRRLILTTDQGEIPTLIATVNGTVRGDVTVHGTEQFQDRIALKTFSGSKGASATVAVETARPGMTLEVESFEPNYLNVELKPKDGPGGTRWDLTVTVPPRRLQGKMPDGSSVILRTDNQRRVRIPIIGRATLALEGR